MPPLCLVVDAAERKANEGKEAGDKEAKGEPKKAEDQQDSGVESPQAKDKAASKETSEGDKAGKGGSD